MYFATVSCLLQFERIEYYKILIARSVFTLCIVNYVAIIVISCNSNTRDTGSDSYETTRSKNIGIEHGITFV